MKIISNNLNKANAACNVCNNKIVYSVRKVIYDASSSANYLNNAACSISKVSLNTACSWNNQNITSDIINDSERIVVTKMQFIHYLASIAYYSSENFANNTAFDSIRKIGCNAACIINDLAITACNSSNNLPRTAFNMQH